MGLFGKSKEQKIKDYLKAGDAADARGDLNGALNSYFQAMQLDDTYPDTVRKFVKTCIRSGNKDLKLNSYKYVMKMAQKYGTSAMTGDDFGLLAVCLYAHVEEGNEAEMDEMLKPFNMTTRGYVLQAISDARYLGCDIPGFKHMEEVCGQGTQSAKESSFFKKK